MQLFQQHALPDAAQTAVELKLTILNPVQVTATAVGTVSGLVASVKGSQALTVS